MQVIDQLGQILNGVDVMVRWWGDERDTGLAAAEVGDVGTDLLARKLTSFSWLGTL